VALAHSTLTTTTTEDTMPKKRKTPTPPRKANGQFRKRKKR
jgi:hypothetical protein